MDYGIPVAAFAACKKEALIEGKGLLELLKEGGDIVSGFICSANQRLLS